MKFFNILNHDREFAMIDICKFIMAFVVIAIHTNPVVNCTDHLVVRSVVIIEEDEDITLSEVMLLNRTEA